MFPDPNEKRQALRFMKMKKEHIPACIAVEKDYLLHNEFMEVGVVDVVLFYFISFISLFLYFFISLFLYFFISLFSLFLYFFISLFLYFFISLFLYYYGIAVEKDYLLHNEFMEVGVVDVVLFSFILFLYFFVEKDYLLHNEFMEVVVGLFFNYYYYYFTLIFYF